MIQSPTFQQAPDAIVMIRPHAFVSNPETMADNSFQTLEKNSESRQTAYEEVTKAIAQLSAEGVVVHQFEDQSSRTPDSVFPNNWFSTHYDGTLIAYPMYAKNRRQEYRQDIMDFLQTQYGYQDTMDLRACAEDDCFLEGTGSVVFDHIRKIAYAARSKRTHENLFRSVCSRIGYQPVLFDAADENGVPVYHTNVLMCIASKFVLIGMDMVSEKDRPALFSLFRQSGLTVISLSNQQIRQFCGNAIELRGRTGKLLALSQTAYNALTQAQRSVIRQSADLLPLLVPTIESAGGSVRCMIAGVHRY